MRHSSRLLGLAVAALVGCDGGTGPEGTPADIGVRVYVDRDASASFTPGDLAVSGATVVLTPTAGGDAVQVATDAEGMARFAGVAPGSYTATVAAQGLPAGTVFSGAATLTVPVPFQGGTIEREFRLEYLPGRITGVIFRDDDDSGGRSAPDTPAAGFTVNLFAGAAATGEPLAIETTDANGAFAFELLPPGSYTLEVEAPVSTVTFAGGPTRQVAVAANDQVVMEVEFEGVLLVSIAEASAQDLGAPVVVEGVVTAGQGTFNARSVYIQDPTAGIQVFGVDAGAGLVPGDSIRVVGTLSAFNGQLQIGSPTVQKLGTADVPEPRALTGAQVNERTYEGSLARVSNVTVTAVSGTATSSSYNVTVVDAAGTSFLVRVSGSSVGIPQTFWTVGSAYDVVGVLGSFRGTAQLLPRSAADVSPVAPPTPIAEAKVLPSGTEVKVTGVVTAGTAQLFNAFYLQDATSGMMVFVGNNPPTPVAPGDSVTVEGDVGAFNGEVQITGGPTVAVHKQVAVPTPRLVTGAEVNARTFEGQLVRVNDVTVTAVSGSATSTSYNVTVRDAAGTEFIVRVSGSSVGIPHGTWTVGSSYDITGVLGSFRGTAQLKPRSSADVTAN